VLCSVWISKFFEVIKLKRRIMRVGGMAKLSLILRDSEQEIPLLPGKSLLDSLEAIVCEAVKVGCRRGGCGLCKVHILKGQYQSRKMSRAHISEAEEAEGYVLACRIFPESDLHIQSDLNSKESMLT